MQIIKSRTNINFLGYRRIAITLSVLLIIASIVSLLTRGLNYGIDFTGGHSVEVRYQQTPDLNDIRELLKDNGIERFVVQYFGSDTDVLIRVEPQKDALDQQKDPSVVGDEVLKVLQSNDSSVEKLRTGYVGPQVGKELKEKGGTAMLLALLVILGYIAFRFQRKFALGAILALVHDVIITLGVFSFLSISFDLTVLAAVLAVIGYSLNDTIVVYDRIRENFRLMRKGTSLEIINASVNQTLTRTLMTSLTTLMVLSALFILGGEIIHGFALALILGVCVGTYSSIYIASTAILALGLKRDDMLLVKKEELDAEGRP